MLNPNLPLEQLSAEFAANGRLQIRDFLAEEAAETLHRCLHEQVSWDLAFTDGTQERKLSAAELGEMDGRARQETFARLQAQAQTGFAFMYNTYMMVTAYQQQRDPQLILNKVLEYLNAEPYIRFLRQVSGVANIVKSDCQATRYIAGHFLRYHNDEHVEQGREVAFVLNLTRHWQADWGGLLQFVEPDGSVSDTVMPRFNSMTMFRVPAGHCVTYVAPYAKGARYAITGWGRSK